MYAGGAGAAAPGPGGAVLGGAGGATGVDGRALYAPILSKLRGLMIARMAKPEEVIVVEDENGNVVRETMKASMAGVHWVALSGCSAWLVGWRVDGWVEADGPVGQAVVGVE